MINAALYQSIFSVEPDEFVKCYLRTSFADENEKKAFLREAILVAMSHNRHITAVLCSVLLGSKSGFIPEKFYPLALKALKKLNAHSNLNLNFDLIPVKKIPSDFINLFFSFDKQIQRQFIFLAIDANAEQPKNYQQLCKVLAMTCSDYEGGDENKVISVLRQMLESSNNPLLLEQINGMLDPSSDDNVNNQTRTALITAMLANATLINKIDPIELEKITAKLFIPDEINEEACQVAVFFYGALVEKSVARQADKMQTKMLLNLMAVGHYPTHLLAKAILEQSESNIMQVINSLKLPLKKGKLHQIHSTEYTFYLAMNFALKRLSGALELLGLPAATKKNLQLKLKNLGVKQSVFSDKKIEVQDHLSELPPETMFEVMAYLSIAEQKEIRLLSPWFHQVYLGKTNYSQLAKHGDYRQSSRDLSLLPNSFCRRFSDLAFTTSGTPLAKIIIYCLAAATVEILLLYTLTAICFGVAEYDPNNAKVLSANYFGWDYYSVRFSAGILPSTPICPLPTTGEAFVRFSCDECSDILAEAISQANFFLRQTGFVMMVIGIFLLLLPVAVAAYYFEFNAPLWKNLNGGRLRNHYQKSEALILQDQATLFLAVINGLRIQKQDPNHLSDLHSGLTELITQLKLFIRDGETKLDLQSVINDLQISKTDYTTLLQTLTPLIDTLEDWRWEKLLSSEVNWACFKRLSEVNQESVAVAPQRQSSRLTHFKSGERQRLLRADPDNDNDDNLGYGTMRPGDTNLVQV